MTGALVVAGDLVRAEPPVSTTVTLDGLTARVGKAGWVAGDHAMDDGYAMPQQMMPGMPTGDDARLSVSVTLHNTDRVTRAFELAGEFVLHGGAETGPRPLAADTFGNLTRLGPGTAVNGMLYFDAHPVGPDAPPLYLEWTRSGRSERLAIPLTGQVPEHH